MPVSKRNFFLNIFYFLSLLIDGMSKVIIYLLYDK